jgi:DnaJ-class molecular chaperone
VSGGHDASEDRFKEIADAWEVLGDPEQRALYDAGGGGGSGCCSAPRAATREQSSASASADQPLAAAVRHGTGESRVMICLHGRSRSASIALAWLTRAHGLLVSLAASILRQKCGSID